MNHNRLQRGGRVFLAVLLVLFSHPALAATIVVDETMTICSEMPAASRQGDLARSFVSSGKAGGPSAPPCCSYSVFKEPHATQRSACSCSFASVSDCILTD